MAGRTSTGCTPDAGGGHRPPLRPGEAASTPPGLNQQREPIRLPPRRRASGPLSASLSHPVPHRTPPSRPDSSPTLSPSISLFLSISQSFSLSVLCGQQEEDEEEEVYDNGRREEEIEELTSDNGRAASADRDESLLRSSSLSPGSLDDVDVWKGRENCGL